MKGKFSKLIKKKNKSKIICLTAYSKNIAETLDNYTDIILIVDIIFNNLDYNELGDLNNDYQLSILDVIIILDLIFNI